MRRIQATGVTSLGRPAAWTPAPIPRMPRGLRSDRATTLHTATGQGEVRVEARRDTAQFSGRWRRSTSACMREHQATETLWSLLAPSLTCANLGAYAHVGAVDAQPITRPEREPPA